MAQASSIEWTDATWNPIRGCSRKSEGCRFCYAEGIAARFSKPGQAYEGLAHRVGGEARWTGKVQLVIDNLDEPLHWRKPRRIFVNSMSDLFHEDVPDAWIDRIFATMALTPQHTYQILTKRADRMRAYLTARNGMGNAQICAAINSIDARRGDRKGALQMPLPNVWLGVSVENQAAADERIPDLLATPAAVRFLSCEPLIGPIDLIWLGHDGDGVIDTLRGEDWIVQWLDNEGTWRERQVVARRNKIDWVICGGESGFGEVRPMHPDWARWLREQCTAAGVPFFFKQWGSCLPGSWDGEDHRGRMAYEIDEEHSSIDYDELGTGRYVDAYGRQFVRFAHKNTGRCLDRRTWDEFPKVQA